LDTTKEYQDYSRDFDPALSWQSFSKDALIELLRLYGQLFAAVDGFWYLSVKEKISNEQALDCDLWVWEKATRYELSRLTKAMNIQGNDVAALMKAFQLSPWFHFTEYKIDLKNKNHAILTIIRCRTLESLEKEGGDRVEEMCGMVDPLIFGNYARFINPNMKVNPLVIPPRQRNQEFCCQWEYRVD